MVKSSLVQALRGVSVILVILFHIGFSDFSNGWVGVDIFLVISGFLMWKIYEHSISEGKILHFYTKRLQRLLPAMLFTILVFSIFFWLRILPFERRDLIRELVGSVTGTSNLLYWSGDEYFSNGSFRPFLNMWSIACELQFYLFFPVTLFLIRGRRKILVILIVVSFLISLTLNVISMPTGFFLLLGRYWEFLIGGFVATRPVLSFRLRQNFWMTALLISVILFFYELRSPLNNFESICFRTFTVIGSGILLSLPANRVPSVLKSRALGLVGDYSYSLYLLHFPLICLMGYKPFTGNFSTMYKSKLVFLFFLVLILLSFLQKRIIEDSRFLRKRAVGLWSFSLIAILLLAASESNLTNLGFSKIQVSVSSAFSDRDPFRCGFFLRVLYTKQPFRSCRVSKGPELKEKVLLVGNSHADAIKSSVSRAIPQFNLYLLNENNALQPDTLKTYIRGVNLLNPKYVILHSSPGSTNLQSLKIFSKYLRSQNISFMVIAPIPQPGTNVPQYLYQNIEGDSVRNHALIPDFSAKEYLEVNMSELHALSVYSKTLNIQIVRTVDLFCTPFCRIVSEHDFRPLYFDSNHLTKTGAGLLEVRIRNSFSSD